MRHHSDHSPFLSLPAPGLSAKTGTEIVSTASLTLTGAYVALVWCPTEVAFNRGRVETFAFSPSGAVDMPPIYYATSAADTSWGTPLPLFTTMALDPETRAHVQYVGAEVYIKSRGTKLNEGGLGVIFDGSSTSSMMELSAAATSFTPNMVQFNLMNTDPRRSGYFNPDGRGHSFRFHPHGVHVDEWRERTRDKGGYEWPNYFMNSDPTSATKYTAAEWGYSQGFAIQSADATQPYEIEIKFFSRVVSKTLQSYGPGTTAVGGHRLFPANPTKMATISTAASELGRIARDSSQAITARRNNTGNSKVLDAIENGVVGGGVVAGTSGLISKFGASAARSDLGTSIMTVAEDVLPLLL